MPPPMSTRWRSRSRRCAPRGGADAGLVGELHGVAHNIKGQGAAFGYDLMTSLGEALCLLTRDKSALDPGAMASVAALIDACRVVLDERLVGSGGAYGAQLSANLGLALKAA